MESQLFVVHENNQSLTWGFVQAVVRYPFVNKAFINSFQYFVLFFESVKMSNQDKIT